MAKLSSINKNNRRIKLSDKFYKKRAKLKKIIMNKKLTLEERFKDKKKLSKDLIITAETADGLIMAIQHKKYNLHGVQFHPESIKTKIGIKILKNFIKFEEK